MVRLAALSQARRLDDAAAASSPVEEGKEGMKARKGAAVRTELEDDAGGRRSYALRGYGVSHTPEERGVGLHSSADLVGLFF
jgi:hypothetical protein